MPDEWDQLFHRAPICAGDAPINLAEIELIFSAWQAPLRA
jgi:hypothetical protein